MAKLSEELRAFLLAVPEIAAITTTIAEGGIPTAEEVPYIWFQRDNQDQPIDLDGTPGLIAAQFSIEAISRDPAEADELTDLIYQNLNGFRGDFGMLFLKGSIVEGKDDNYIVRNPTDDGEFVSAVNLQLQL